jgi:hypothetical protein
MEHLWSRAVANHGNRAQTAPPRRRLNYLRSAAEGCHRLRPPLHGKEGFNGSSPLEGLKVPGNRDFCFQTCNLVCGGVRIACCGRLLRQVLSEDLWADVRLPERMQVSVVEPQVGVRNAVRKTCLLLPALYLI